MKIRCFDLGGSGLKTCLFENDSQPIHTTNLGRAENPDIASWIRKALPSLDDEVNSGAFFSFSLAGLDKLTTSRHDFQIKSETDPISNLFGLPSLRVFTQKDGDSHLLASRVLLKITRLPHINFSVGTGVGFGICDENGALVRLNDLTQVLECSPWDLVTNSSASNRKVYFALAKCGFNELMTNHGKEVGLKKFGNRWAKFLCEVLFPKFKSANWKIPMEVTFTGGVTEHNQWVDGCVIDGCRIQKGPDDAGIHGARLFALGAISKAH